MHDAAECTAKKSMPKAADKVKEFYEPDDGYIILQYQEMEPGEKEASLYLFVWLLFCPLSLERPWTAKLCRRNVVSAN